MISSNRIIADLERLRRHIEHSPGHEHLYTEFEGILTSIARFRSEAHVPDAGLASEILVTVGLLLRENSVGRRPWEAGWETYFKKCMENACRLLKEFAAFRGYLILCPLGYCNQFLDAFVQMDRYDQEYWESHPHLSQHFARLASCAAEMFSLVADRDARIQEELLEHSDDKVFQYLLTGYARSGTSKAYALLHGYLKDDEAWVRHLAGELIVDYFNGQ